MLDEMQMMGQGLSRNSEERQDTPIPEEAATGWQEEKVVEELEGWGDQSADISS